MMEIFAFWLKGFGVGFGSGLILLCSVFPYQAMKKALGEGLSS